MKNVISRFKKCIDLEQKIRLITAATVIICTIISILFIGFFLKNAVEQIHASLIELDIQKQLIEIKEENYRNKDKNQQELKTVKEHRLAPTVITLSQLPKAVDILSGWMSRTNVTETEFSINDREILNEEVLRVNFKIDGTGRYEDVIEYIQGLYNTDFYYILEEVSIRAGKLENNVDVNAKISILAYNNEFDTQAGKQELPAGYKFFNPFELLQP